MVRAKYTEETILERAKVILDLINFTYDEIEGAVIATPQYPDFREGKETWVVFIKWGSEDSVRGISAFLAIDDESGLPLHLAYHMVQKPLVFQINSPSEFELIKDGTIYKLEE